MDFIDKIGKLISGDKSAAKEQRALAEGGRESNCELRGRSGVMCLFARHVVRSSVAETLDRSSSSSSEILGHQGGTCPTIASPSLLLPLPLPQAASATCLCS